MRYTVCVNRRGTDHLPLKLSLKVCALSPMVILSHRSLSKGLFANHLLSMVSGWWCSRLPMMVLVVIPFWRRGKRTHTLTKRSDAWQSGQTGILSKNPSADIVLAVSTVAFQATRIGSNPIICSIRPLALTHSPTPGSKCGVLSNGFLASKRKPVYIPFRRACGPVRVGRGEHSILYLWEVDREDLYNFLIAHWGSAQIKVPA